MRLSGYFILVAAGPGGSMPFHIEYERTISPGALLSFQKQLVHEFAPLITLLLGALPAHDLSAPV